MHSHQNILTLNGLTLGVLIIPSDASCVEPMTEQGKAYNMQAKAGAANLLGPPHIWIFGGLLEGIKKKGPGGRTRERGGHRGVPPEVCRSPADGKGRPGEALQVGSNLRRLDQAPLALGRGHRHPSPPSRSLGDVGRQPSPGAAPQRRSREGPGGVAGLHPLMGRPPEEQGAGQGDRTRAPHRLAEGVDPLFPGKAGPRPGAGWAREQYSHGTGPGRQWSPPYPVLANRGTTGVGGGWPRASACRSVASRPSAVRLPMCYPHSHRGAQLMRPRISHVLVGRERSKK